MTELTAYEATWLSVLEELRGCPDIRLDNGDQAERDLAGDADQVFAELAERDGIELDPSLKSYHLRFTSMAAVWDVPDPEYEEESLIAGEFDLLNIHQAVRGGALLARLYDPTPEERQLYSELRSFDGTGETGVGHLSMLRIQPGVADPELWFDATTKGYHRMDVDYPGYLEALRITKGTFGWQFLFTDVSMHDEGQFAVSGRFMEIMLDLFPKLFPDHDYAPLRERLAERRPGFRA
ncbi:hypothetical protein A8924_5107 [Saccharopolyspora erythraea NRRL 2338]|uniref:Uncharacterized protein n=2 Tax=Saccharopolyspora erythraea TaxID=1836 RepID=A4FIW5_SACEN|nr:hypothetical protein [Saccharopolyspora erythraea]EQD83297.1 hypothetical protein N599_26035 [Saccharopolyspora erythraea D]PFG97663.1 hypothetical protein A8924_5107 [Saccharopolyspora erythraea NRRL 2338]QRK87819.1 hypothetical protein JQX30_24025 [Saccharopolyspora erythraea]CAM03990.1 hypothetical protein SACE_4722 [Saccharopolyspora erythraea NRRL 2338]